MLKAILAWLGWSNSINSVVKKYLQTLTVIESVEVNGSIKVTVDVPDGTCYVVNNYPLTTFSNVIHIDKGERSKATIEFYQIKESEVNLEEYGTNNTPCKVLVRYNS
ncbi:MAG: hypothetical protein ACRCXZ_10355, partial [Patescibacteria group bacterium]